MHSGPRFWPEVLVKAQEARETRRYIFVIARIALLIIALLFITSPQLLAIETNLPVKLFDEAYSRVFKVGIADSVSSEIKAHGTGFAVSESGFIATAYHVVEGAIVSTRRKASLPEVFVIRNGVRIKATVWAIDSKNDLAILKIPVALPKPWPVKSRVLGNGSSLFLLGYPGPVEFSIITGLLQSSTISEIIPTYQITSPVTGGMSGGPVISTGGEVVGVILAAYSGGGDISLAGQGRVLSELLEKASNRIEEPDLEALRAEVEKGHFDLQNQQAKLIKQIIENRSEFHGWSVPSTLKAGEDVACKEWDFESDNENSRAVPSRECKFKLATTGDVATFKLEFQVFSPRSNQFKAADLASSLSNFERRKPSKGRKYGKFACKPDMHLKKKNNSLVVSICSRISNPSLKAVDSIVRVASLDFSRPALVASMELKSFSQENSEKLILEFVDGMEESHEQE